MPGTDGGAVRGAPRLPTAPADVVLTPARHSQSLEIVVTGRADDHGGPEFLERLVAAASHNHALLTAPASRTPSRWSSGTRCPGRRLLAETVAERLPFWGRVYVVDPAWHAAISTNPRLQFMEFFAKNVAVRRSTADAILTTNSDVFLSEALVARLAEAPLEDEHVYRAVRYDVDRHCDWRAAGKRCWPIRGTTCASTSSRRPSSRTAAGDFLLLTRATWHRLRGFNETVRFAKIHKDGQFCHRAWIEGLSFDTLGPIWHLDHDGSYSNAGTLRGSPDAPTGRNGSGATTIATPTTGGLWRRSRRRTRAGLVRLRHRAAETVWRRRRAEPAAARRACGRPRAPGGARRRTRGARDVARRARLRDGARVAIGGPDWATPWLAAAARAAGHVVVGLYTADARVVGTVRCGYVARPSLTSTRPARTSSSPACSMPASRRACGRPAMPGRCTACSPAPADALPANLPSELAMLLDVQHADDDDSRCRRRREDGARRGAGGAGRPGPVRARLRGRARLGEAGPADDAARAFGTSSRPRSRPALRVRARFHLGRLCYERGDHTAAREHLRGVLRSTPDHRRARGYLEAMNVAPGGRA